MLARLARGAPASSLAVRALAVAWAAFVLSGCAQRGAPTGPYPAFQQFEGREIRRVTYAGELILPRDSVAAVVTTRPSRCRALGFIPVCIGGFGRQTHELDLAVLARDVVRIQLLYRDAGYYGTRVVPNVEDAGGEKVNVRFSILPGDLVRLRTLEIAGTEGVIDSAQLARKVPLKVGEPFRRIDFLASVDTVRNTLLERGHAYAQVLRNYSLDTIADVADVRLEASPGPVVTVDSIIFEGMYRLTDRTARHQLSFREGSRLRAGELVRSQRNLYDLELVEYATVEVAPESLQVTPDSAELERDSIGSTVLVRIVEAPRYAVDVSGGYGTVDCFRAAATHTDRNFLGGARRLQLSGSVAKVGVGEPLDAGLEGSLCREFRLEETSTRVDSLISTALNYRLAADFLQPRLFGTRTSVGAGLHAERISELGLYLREDFGGQLGFIRQVAPATVLSATYQVERGSTEASDFFFCIAYEVCIPELIDLLEEPRWSNNLSVGLVRNRVRLDPFPTGGHRARIGTDYASNIIGSQDEYLRFLGDGSVYREVGRDIVLELRLSGGSFLTGLIDQGFIPPQKRFYAGGPTTVRGFRRNELGPTVYIRQIDPADPDDPEDEPDTTYAQSATGGERMVVGTAEVTAPSPFLRNILRVAAFVDGGQVWSSDTLATRPGLRFTPGAGVRAATPVGPIRIDVAYNAYPREKGPLFELRGDSLVGPLQRDFAPDDVPSFWKRLVLSISIGQTF